MNSKSSRSIPDKRGLAAGATALAGLALLGWAFLQPPKEAGVPGWTPVNEQVAEALLPFSETEPAPSPAAQPSAVELQAAAGTAPASSGASEPSPASSGTSEPSPASSGTSESSPASSGASESSPLPSAPESAVTESVPDGRLNLNAATAEQLDELKGIGPSKAQAIVAYREEHGAFKSVEELLQVNGIGAKVFAAIRDSLKV
ncbi:ComEA family DNA-binding protein [Cohnella thailandensis]|uniref:Helix-hairpin-helix domain-containing protein n=1 Tax=Cohnella thailandensis TaxID=557557 RepID=A0A841SZX6_9BACL|nr:helix-hairpin-helix domain-containing protein [Cohnella thailandensis]MBB6636176.1 helix-hairpin-helix domain-containing protein [Cohnella thailandensis]MBP1973855.1 competence protein ComEA [Cohnella thailandensis]